MNRRAYLATATALTLGGCMGTGGPDETGSRNETEDPADGNETEGADATDEEEGDAENEEDEAEGDEEPAVETIDDFEDLEAWETVAGSVSAAEDRSYAGSQPALLEAAEDDEQVRIVREFDEPLDVSGRVPGLAVTADATADPTIQLIDEDGDRIDYSQAVHGGVPFTRVNFGIGNVDGEPDLSSIAEVQIALWTGDEGGEAWVDDLHLVPSPERGRVMIQFDGGYETVYSDAFPILEEYDYPATVFVPTARVRADEEHDGDRLTEDQLAELHDAGWAIGSYGARGLDLTEMDADEQEAELVEAREWLEDAGYGDGAGYFAYPSGEYDETVVDLAAEHADLAFAGRYPAQGHSVTPELNSRVPDPDAADAERMLEWTADYGGVTALTYYQLEESLADFESAVDFLFDLETEGDLEVIAPAEFEDEFVL